jgi:hypothetical protein
MNVVYVGGAGTTEHDSRVSAPFQRLIFKEAALGNSRVNVHNVHDVHGKRGSGVAAVGSVSPVPDPTLYRH